MADGVTVAGALLVAGPLIGAVPVANPSIVRIWSMSRIDHIRTVGAHRRAWAWLNAGFLLATVTTAGGLAILPVALTGDAARSAVLTGLAVAYAIGGALWGAVLAIRTRTTPALADLVAADVATEPAEGLIGAAVGGLFAAFVLLTGIVLAALGLTLVLAGGVSLPVAVVAVAVSLLVLAAQLATGDAIPAVLYLPTMLIGIALLAGWT
jgi:hypothetical protein